MSATARILLFTGDGKGKTTAAVGMAVRAAGHSMRVCVIQFIKSAPSGELAGLARLPGVEVTQTGLGFVPPPESPESQRHQAAAQAGLDQAAAAIASGRFDLVVLDEICVAVAKGLLEERQVIQAVRKAAEGMVVVLTGRGATPGLIDLADTVTEMRCVKHALDSGRAAQGGVEC